MSSNAGLPVIVWIHGTFYLHKFCPGEQLETLCIGGGYTLGDASDEAQDFVKESGYRFVSVNMQYRLGIFGEHPSPSRP